jgi:hypothetical protein
MEGECLGNLHAQDVSSLRDFYEVNLELALPGAPISFYEVEEGIVSTGHVLPPVLVHACEIENSLVGEGSVLQVWGFLCLLAPLLHAGTTSSSVYSSSARAACCTRVRMRPVSPHACWETPGLLLPQSSSTAACQLDEILP